MGQAAETGSSEPNADDRVERLVRTRLSLHAVAELLMAGPQYERSASIELRVSPGGFATTRAPDLRVDEGDIVAGERRLAMDARSVSALAEDLGVGTRDLRDVYADGPELGVSAVLRIDHSAAEEIARAYGMADVALARLAPKRRRILWPEHFDVGIDVDEVNYGVSPGDSRCSEPYAYVGPWKPPSTDGEGFWNASFGASHPIAEMADEQGLLAFFSEGRARAQQLRG
jgi:hypothetical protein